MKLTRPIVVLTSLILLALGGFIVTQPAFTQDTETTEETTTAPDNAELQRMIETAVSQKIRPLQREIADLKEEIRFHDILGGIGYIVGVTGIVFYFLGVRRRESNERTNNTE